MIPTYIFFSTGLIICSLFKAALRYRRDGDRVALKWKLRGRFLLREGKGSAQSLPM